VPTQSDNPRTRDFIEFTLSAFAFQYQSGDVPHQSFGTYNNNGTPDDNTDFTFDEDKIKLFSLDDKEKDLIPIANTNYTINADKNLIKLNPEAAAGSSTVEVLSPIDTSPPPIIRGKGESSDGNGRATDAIYTEVITKNSVDFVTPIDFFPDLFTIPAGYDFFSEMPLSFALFFNHFIFHATSNESTDHFNRTAGISTVFSGAKGQQIKFNNRAFSKTPAVDNAVASAHSFPINHVNDSLFINNTSIKLALKMTVTSTVNWIGSPETPDQSREIACGFNVFIRFRRFDGTYEYSAAQWKYEFPAKVLGVSHQGVGKLGESD